MHVQLNVHFSYVQKKTGEVTASACLIVYSACYLIVECRYQLVNVYAVYCRSFLDSLHLRSRTAETVHSDAEQNG